MEILEGDEGKGGFGFGGDGVSGGGGGGGGDVDTLNLISLARSVLDLELRADLTDLTVDRAGLDPIGGDEAELDDG